MKNKLLKKIKNLDYKKYFIENDLKKLVNVSKFKNKNFDPRFIFENNNKTPYPPDINDLIRLHYIIREKKIVNVLEFGVGFSTIIMADAIYRNKIEHNNYVRANFRKVNPFKIHSVDSNKKYINLFRKKIPKYLINIIDINYSESEITQFNGQICSNFKKLPNVSPELIYADGPSFLDIKESINGINFNHMERTIINCDILKIESLLFPGTIIVWDGQTNNARFNFVNFRRKWFTTTLRKEDISIAIQVEEPLGYLNENFLKFSDT